MVQVRTNTRPAHWPTTVGTITASQTVSEYRGTSFGRFRSSAIYHSRFYLAYTYRVGGAELVGHKIDAITRLGRKYQYTGLDRYPIGKQVIVRYNPADPTVAVLESGVPVGWVLACAGAVMLMVVIVLQPTARASVDLRVQRPSA